MIFKPLVLASQSPRRKELLSALDCPFQVVQSDLSEGDFRESQDPKEEAQHLALMKAREVVGRVPNALVLGADTVVVLNGRVMGKPRDESEAVRMLAGLRGRKHQVVTGMAVVDGATGRSTLACRETTVLMRDYSDYEIRAYVSSGKALDKAGAYGIQDAEFHPAASIEGCYLNVVGLPLCELVSLLETFDLRTRPRPGWNPPPECVDCPFHGNERLDQV